MAAAALLGKVVDDHAILEAATDERTGLGAWLALPPQDRALARAIALTSLRHRGQISAVVEKVTDRPPPKRARHLLHSLHVAIAQILYMEVPESAAVNLAVSAIGGDPRTARFAGFANAVLRRVTRERTALSALAPHPQRAFAEWLARQIARDHGRERAGGIAMMMAEQPVLDLTPHPGLDADGRRALAEEIGAVELPTGSLRVCDSRPVASLPGYEEGAWWVQDTAASLPVRLLGDVAGMEIADLCAAPGGKTMQLAAAGARVTAVDISGARLGRLEQNLQRTRLVAEIVEADLLDWRPDRQFDAVMLDAPCSATGTMRRHPDIAWNRTPEDVAALVDLQKRLLGTALALLRPGGVMVYANCSILKSEGEGLVAGLDDVAPGLKVAALTAQEFPVLGEWINGQGALRTLPLHLPANPPRNGGMDGFFACRLRTGC